MQVSSVSSVAPISTGVPSDDRAVLQRERLREEAIREARQKDVQPALPSGVGGQLDRQA